MQLTAKQLLAVDGVLWFNFLEKS